MARGLKCDICGEFYALQRGEKSAIKFGSHNADGNTYYLSNDAIDVCPECMLAIVSVMEERKAKKK